MICEACTKYLGKHGWDGVYRKRVMRSFVETYDADKPDISLRCCITHIMKSKEPPSEETYTNVHKTLADEKSAFLSILFILHPPLF